MAHTLKVPREAMLPVEIAHAQTFNRVKQQLDAIEGRLVSATLVNASVKYRVELNAALAHGRGNVRWTSHYIQYQRGRKGNRNATILPRVTDTKIDEYNPLKGLSIAATSVSDSVAGSISLSIATVYSCLQSWGVNIATTSRGCNSRAMTKRMCLSTDRDVPFEVLRAAQLHGGLD